MELPINGAGVGGGAPGCGVVVLTVVRLVVVAGDDDVLELVANDFIVALHRLIENEISRFTLVVLKKFVNSLSSVPHWNMMLQLG
jgi:hypothetical protein